LNQLENIEPEIKHKKPFFENLDALRFFAAFSVFIAHCVIFFDYKFSLKLLHLIQWHFFFNGDLGVNFFFVLSGFLISCLLLIERERNQKINLLYFYMRRILKIWPVYFIIVIAGFIIGTKAEFNFISNPLFSYKIDISQLKWYVSFLANYNLIYKTSMLLAVLWSVSVEEQFYLFWPLIIVFFKKRIFPIFCFIIILLSFLFRVFLTKSHYDYLSTFYVVSDLAFGGLICYYSMYNKVFIDYFTNIKKRTIILIYLLLFIYVPLRGFSHIFGDEIYKVYAPFERIFFSFFFGFIVIEQNFSKNSIFKFGKLKIISKLGKMSYGIYCYHMFGLLFAFYIANILNLNSSNFWHYLIKIIVAFVFTLSISYLSFHLIEKNILKLKDKFNYE
jgi:peptidoglycan/LPS O-acetylase OafA/YrhL